MVGPSILMEVGLLVINLCHYNFSANIHLFRMKDTNILLDVNSGAVHVLDDQTFCFVEELIRNRGDWELAQSRTAAAYSPEAVKEIGKEIEEAYRAGSLFTEEGAEFDYSSSKSICLNVAHLCNMRCRYCFAQQEASGNLRD